MGSIQKRLVIDGNSGLLQNIRYCPSPNCDDRPIENEIQVLVVHAISLPPRHFGGAFIEQLFTNTLDCSAHLYFHQLENTRVSAHFLIRRTGGLVQFVPAHKRAWHAGVSRFCERECVNDFSVGVELEGSDYECFTDSQYSTLTELTQALMQKYPALTASQIVGHSDIAPGRKTDPGPHFNWQRFRASLQKCKI